MDEGSSSPSAPTSYGHAWADEDCPTRAPPRDDGSSPAADSKELVPERAGQAYFATRSEDVQERLERANQMWAEYEPDELAERTIEAEDGR
jgi:hypothetical protein